MLDKETSGSGSLRVGSNSCHNFRCLCCEPAWDARDSREDLGINMDNTNTDSMSAPIVYLANGYVCTSAQKCSRATFHCKYPRNYIYSQLDSAPEQDVSVTITKPRFKIASKFHLPKVGSLVSLVSYVPWSQVAIFGMVIQPLIGNPYNGYINPYYWVDDHPLLYGNNGS